MLDVYLALERLGNAYVWEIAAETSGDSLEVLRQLRVLERNGIVEKAPRPVGGWRLAE